MAGGPWGAGGWGAIRARAASGANANAAASANAFGSSAGSFGASPSFTGPSSFGSSSVASYDQGQGMYQYQSLLYALLNFLHHFYFCRFLLL